MIVEKVETVFDALAYEAPFLTEKLVKEQIVETPEEAATLFGEVKRYLILAFTDETVSWEMYSRRVDEVWHQFVLFTREYVAFSTRYFNRYIHHNPGNAPGGTATYATQGTFEGFKHRYEEVFGVKLPSVWYDEKSIFMGRRIINQNVGKLTLRDRPSRTDLLDGSGNVLLSVNDIARQALAFLSRTGAFYVRELPGGLIDEDKIALIATLVKYNVLRVGS
jgi:hypothetical protein